MTWPAIERGHRLTAAGLAAVTRDAACALALWFEQVRRLKTSRHTDAKAFRIF